MFTIKSTSDEGIYYLVNHWDRHKTFWVEPENIKPEMLFKTPADAKRSLTKLLKVMDEYKNDTFELVEVDVPNLALFKGLSLESEESNPDLLHNTDELVGIWFKSLLESSGKSSVEALTPEEIKAEIDEITGTIDNERMWALSDSIHSGNVESLTEYLNELYVLFDKVRPSLDDVIEEVNSISDKQAKQGPAIVCETNKDIDR